MRIFISHSSANADISENICSYLEKNGHSCFFAPRDIRSGFPYAEEIMNGIDGSDALILVLSQKSNESPHVLREIERAVSLDLPIIVYKTEEVALTKSMEYFLMSHQWLNTDTDTGFGKLLEGVNGLQIKEKKVDTSSEAKTDSAAKSKKPFPVAICIAAVIGIIALIILLIVLINGNGSNGSVSSSQESTTNSSAVTESTDGTTKDESVTILPPGEVGGLEEVKPGDTITFGTYNDEPIKWRILTVEGNIAFVVSDNILTMKCYDAAESGKYNYIGNDDYWNEDISTLPMMTQKKLRGSNQWHLSNIRTWLNSDRENVQYNDQPPTSAAMPETVNGYDKEAGFLNGFTREEKTAIVPTPIKTNNGAMDVTTDDLVFLLSKDELELLQTADVSIAAKPTEKAVEQNKSTIYGAYSLDLGVEDHYWWLRDNGGAAGYEGYLVCNSYAENKVISYPVGVEGFGIRPAMKIRLTTDVINKIAE
ncbi:MAG: toll/interleukin-1 receptor domain-containing protein [Ruminiclostridium sp.]|nr:toll/interleukin-1 receptor domain-containing protein [Ruminiclostridium sp.]